MLFPCSNSPVFPITLREHLNSPQPVNSCMIRSDLIFYSLHYTPLVRPVFLLNPSTPLVLFPPQDLCPCSPCLNCPSFRSSLSFLPSFGSCQTSLPQVCVACAPNLDHAMPTPPVFSFSFLSLHCANHNLKVQIELFPLIICKIQKEGLYLILELGLHTVSVKEINIH